MKKLIALVAITGLLMSSLTAPADAKKKKKGKTERTIEHDYTFGSPGVATGAGVSAGACLASTFEQTGCINIPLAEGEVYVTVSVTDSAGQPYGILAQDTDTSTPAYEIFAEFCGETPQAIPVTPGLELRVSLYEVGPPQSCPGPTGTGTMTVTLSNLP